MRRIGMMVRGACLPCALLALATVPLHAQDSDTQPGALSRAHLGRVLAVLRLQPEAAGQSCLDSLRDLHKTEDQFKALQGKTNNPDLGLAQDVLESDYENSNQICGADADRLCAAPSGIKGLQGACGALRRGPEGGR